MKKYKLLSALIFMLSLVQLQAQMAIPKGFKKGTLVLQDNTILSGLVKDDIRSNASVLFLNENTKMRKSFDGNELLSATIDSIRFICLKGDFFRELCNGSRSLLQKASDASRKPTYNGSEAIFSNGTDGKPGDYCIYDNTSHQLKIIPKKNIDLVISESFASCTAAIEKSKIARAKAATKNEAGVVYTNQSKN